MKKTKKFYATLVLTAFAMIAMIVGIYAVLNNVAMQASGNITYKAFGCDVKVVGQISNAVKESADGSLFYNNKTDYLEDMESFIGANDGWTIGDISFDYESSLEIKPIIITLDVYNYSIHPIFATLNIGAEFQQIANASNVDITAKVDSQDYVLGSEFYIAEATFDASKTFVSYTHRIFEITISVDDDSTNMEMASRITLFEMLFEKTLRQYDNHLMLTNYISSTKYVSSSYLYETATNSTFSGWAGSIGAPETINNIKFKVGARDIPITQINVLLAETDRNGTLVASEILNVKIDANTNQEIFWQLSTPIYNTTGKTYYFGWSANQFANLFLDIAETIDKTLPIMAYCINGNLATDFKTVWSNCDGTDVYYRHMPVEIGEVVPVVEYQDHNFTKTSSTYTGELKADYTTSTFSGWGGTIGAPEQFNALRFRVGARDNAITAINMFITEETHKGKIIRGASYSINIEPNTYKDIVWKLSTPITNNTKNLYFTYVCNQYCNLYKTTAIATEIQTVYTYECQIILPTLASVSNTHFVMAVDLGEVHSNPATGEEEDTPTGEGILQTVDVHLANSYDLVVGDVFQMFYRGVIRAVNPYNYYIKVVCSKGNSFPRFWQWTPTESDVGAHSLSIKVLNDNGQLIGKDTTTLNVVNPMKNTTYTTAKNILCVGDSLTAAGIWFKEGYRRFCMAGGTPAGLENTDSLNFIGTKSVTVDGKTIGYEGVGGWSWATYLGSNSPFYNTATSSIDFVNYCTANGFAGIDEVYFLLTWNGFGAHYFDEYPTDTGNLKNAQTLIDTLKAQFPNVKVTCLGIPLSSLGGGTGTNYGTNSVYGDAYGIYMTAFAYNIALEKLCLSDKYSSFVRYVDTKAQFDGDYNYPTSDVPVNSRNPQTETIQSNGVHPNQYGYLQIGDAFYRALCSRYKAE